MDFPQLIHIESFRSQFDVLERSIVDFCLTAASVSFASLKHPIGVRLTVSGEVDHGFDVFWDEPNTLRGWEDLDRATEFGGYGMSFILMETLTEYKVHSARAKGDGYDFVLSLKGEMDDPNGDEWNFLNPPNMARLEVSATRRKSAFGSRKTIKEKQTRKSDATGTGAYVVVVDFETPRAIITYRHGIS